MNVLVSNKKKNELNSLDIDVIKSITGEYEAAELVSMFQNFFYEKIIIDITAIRNYINIDSIEKLVNGLGNDKIILLITDELCTYNYLSILVNLGIYNFTNNINAIKRLLERPNTYEDVSKVLDATRSSIPEEHETKSFFKKNENVKILGFKNVTEKGGSTSLIYMMMNELKNYFSHVYAIELNKEDFKYFNNKSMLSISDFDFADTIDKLGNYDIILVDLNDSSKEDMCDDVVYLMEPSTIMLNQLISDNINVFDELKNNKLILNKSMLTNKDVTDFESESNSKIFYNIPPLDDRVENQILLDFASRVGLIDDSLFSKDGNKIFGLFGH